MEIKDRRTSGEGREEEQGGENGRGEDPDGERPGCTV